jgi:hypothetical protein
MRAVVGLAGISALGRAVPASPAGAVCSVFDNCAPTVCSVYQRRPCIPQFDPPIGKDLRRTIESRRRPSAAAVRPITATRVRQIASMGSDASAFVPSLVAAKLKAKFGGNA